jgi:hypothetical protein
MQTYWKDQGGDDESFWEHEWRFVIQSDIYILSYKSILNSVSHEKLLAETWLDDVHRIQVVISAPFLKA